MCHGASTLFIVLVLRKMANMTCNLQEVVFKYLFCVFIKLRWIPVRLAGDLFIRFIVRRDYLMHVLGQ